jgi:hypothetical protein
MAGRLRIAIGDDEANRRVLDERSAIFGVE